jgi:hypothetical protein
MPTFDGGHYFLTALVPVRTDTIKEPSDQEPPGQGSSGRESIDYTSPVHALRKRLAMLATARQSPASGNRPCPFAGNRRDHFVRFVIIDDVAYNGRDHGNTFVNAAIGTTLTNAQPQDHLSCPFLLFAAEFDAASGADAERDSYLAELWDKMKGDLRQIFEFCQGFGDSRAKDGATFAAYIAKCQIETTMSFNDYYAVSPDLPAWPAKAYLWAAGASGLVALVALFVTLLLCAAVLFVPSLLWALRCGLALSLLGAAALGIVVATAYVTVMAAGAKPFPTAPDANLPAVLKALHLQRVFSRFAIDNQELAAGTDARSAQQLYDNFAAFVAANRPDDLGKPTQEPGVIGI